MSNMARLPLDLAFSALCCVEDCTQTTICFRFPAASSANRTAGALAAVAVAVAGITIHAVPNVSSDPLVLRVGLRLRMAARTCEHRIVGRISMAVAAQPRVAVRKREPRVVEVSAGP